MKIQISAKNYPMSDKLSNYIEKKLGKLDKYFNEDVAANVVVSKLRETPKFEATINAKQAVFLQPPTLKNVKRMRNAHSLNL